VDQTTEVTVSLVRAVRLAGASRSALGVDGNVNRVDEAFDQRLLTSLLLHVGSDHQSRKIVKIAKPDPINSAIEET